MQAIPHQIPATALNNTAISYLQVGGVCEAMELLQIALGKIRDRFNQRNNSTQQTTSSSTSTIKSTPCPYLRDEEDSTMDTTEEDSVRKPSPSTLQIVSSIPVWMQHDHSFLAFFDRALLIDDTNRPQEDDEVVSAVILFNMALLHHSRGVDTGKTDFLERANRLYKIALDILKKQESYHNTSNNCLLLMAIFNNMAHISSYLVRMDDMMDQLEEMRDILSTQDEELEAQVDDEDYELFFMNAMFAEGEDFMVAPAA